MSSIARSELYTRENILGSISALRYLADETARVINKYNNCPVTDSTAIRERNSFPNNELVKDVHSRGSLSIESAGDHLFVFIDSISEPAKTIAPWTCIRGLLESCALAIWFLDPTIDVKTRVGRCFAFRYSGFVEQIKYFGTENETAQIATVKARLKKVEQDAVSLGYRQLLNKRGEINGIAMQMPTIIELIKSTLDRESDYRLLSGVAHGHHWATSQIGFRVSEVNVDGQILKTLEKHLHPEGVLFASQIAATSFAKSFWSLGNLYGWNRTEIIDLLDAVYDRLHFNAKIRFWRSSSAT